MPSSLFKPTANNGGCLLSALPDSCCLAAELRIDRPLLPKDRGILVNGIDDPLTVKRGVGNACPLTLRALNSIALVVLYQFHCTTSPPPPIQLCRQCFPDPILST